MTMIWDWLQFLGLVSLQKNCSSFLLPSFRQNNISCSFCQAITHLPLPHLKTKDRDRLDTERDIYHLIFWVNDGEMDLNHCITFTFWFLQMKITFESAPCTRLPPPNAHFCCLVEQENRLDFSCSCNNLLSRWTDQFRIFVFGSIPYIQIPPG